MRPSVSNCPTKPARLNVACSYVSRVQDDCIYSTVPTSEPNFITTLLHHTVWQDVGLTKFKRKSENKDRFLSSFSCVHILKNLLRQFRNISALQLHFTIWIVANKFIARPIFIWSRLSEYIFISSGISVY